MNKHVHTFPRSNFEFIFFTSSSDVSADEVKSGVVVTEGDSHYKLVCRRPPTCFTHIRDRLWERAHFAQVMEIKLLVYRVRSFKLLFPSFIWLKKPHSLSS